jgi:TonB family protein
MKTVWLLLFSVCFLRSAYAAADISVTPPRWFQTPTEGTTLPAFAHEKAPAYDKERPAYEGLGYVVISLVVDEKGRRDTWSQQSSHEYLTRVLKPWVDELRFKPALKGDRRTRSYVWLSVLFNPPSADSAAPDATPRLLAVAPAIVSRDTLVQRHGLFTGEMVNARFTVDELGRAGALQLATDDEPLRSELEQALAQWKFAPARREGRAYATEVRLPIALASAKPITLPKATGALWYGYPAAMKSRGLIGDVTVSYVVNEQGKAVEPRIVQSTHEGFNEIALEAVCKWSYEPATEDGVPFAVRVQRTIEYRLPGGVGTYVDREKWKVVTQRPEPDPAPAPAEPFRIVYPYALLREGVAGTATIRYQISYKGYVDGNDVRSATAPDFGFALTAAVEAAHYPKNAKQRSWLLQLTHPFDPMTDLTPEDARMLQREKDHAGTIIGAQKLDSPLKAVATCEPVHPFTAKGKYDLGKAVVECVVDEEGVVRLPRVVSADLPELGYAAVQAAAQWRFEPPVSGGRPAAVRVRLPFRFEGTRGAPVGSP